MSASKHRSLKTRALLAAAALAGISAAHADAGLIVDLRAVGGSSGVIISQDGKTVYASGPGDTVTLHVFAQVSGTDGDNTNERLTSGAGSLISYLGTPPATSDRLLGNLAGGRTERPQRFDHPGPLVAGHGPQDPGDRPPAPLGDGLDDLRSTGTDRHLDLAPTGG